VAGFQTGWRRPLVNFVVKHVKRLVPAASLPGAVPLPYALEEGESLALADPGLGHDDLAFLQYTGGTTGVAKGAMLSHGNLVANLMQAAAWLHSATREGEEIVITALPLYHIFSLTANCLVFMSIGGENVLVTDPRDMKGFVRLLSRVKFTATLPADPRVIAKSREFYFGAQGNGAPMALGGQ